QAHHSPLAAPFADQLVGDRTQILRKIRIIHEECPFCRVDLDGGSRIEDLIPEQVSDTRHGNRVERSSSDRLNTKHQTCYEHVLDLQLERVELDIHSLFVVGEDQGGVMVWL